MDGTVTFDCNYDDPTEPVQTLTWDFGDGSTGDCPQASSTTRRISGVLARPARATFTGSITHVYAAAGTYSVTLTATPGGVVTSGAITISAPPPAGISSTTTTTTDTSIPASALSAPIIPVTGGSNAPVLIPVTGVDLGVFQSLARRLSLNLGIAFLGLGLGLHGLSLRRRKLEN